MHGRHGHPALPCMQPTIHSTLQTLLPCLIYCSQSLLLRLPWYVQVNVNHEAVGKGMHCHCCTISTLGVLRWHPKRPRVHMHVLVSQHCWQLPRPVHCLTRPESVLSYILKSLRILKALSLLLPSLALMRSRMVLIIFARRLLCVQAADRSKALC
jgi:hypothetical protein